MKTSSYVVLAVGVSVALSSSCAPLDTRYVNPTTLRFKAKEKTTVSHMVKNLSHGIPGGVQAGYRYRDLGVTPLEVTMPAGVPAEFVSRRLGKRPSAFFSGYFKTPRYGGTYDVVVSPPRPVLAWFSTVGVAFGSLGTLSGGIFTGMLATDSPPAGIALSVGLLAGGAVLTALSIWGLDAATGGAEIMRTAE